MVPSGRVLPDVGQPRDHAAAQGAAVDAHVVSVVPLVGLLVVALHVEGGGEAVEAAHHEQEVIHHLDAEVAARIEHGGDCAPGVSHWAVGLCTPESVSSVEAAYLRAATKRDWLLTPGSVHLGSPSGGGGLVMPHLPPPMSAIGEKPFQTLPHNSINLFTNREARASLWSWHRGTHRVHVLSIGDHAYPAPPAPHGRYDGPLVALGVVHLGCEQALVPVKPAAYVDLWEAGPR